VRALVSQNCLKYVITFARCSKCIFYVQLTVLVLVLCAQKSAEDAIASGLFAADVTVLLQAALFHYFNALC